MGANILIVEDEEPLTTLLRYNLEAEGYEVDAVARGDDADTRLKETAPDLVVLDWILTIGDLELDREKKRVSRATRPVDLGPTEFRLLEFLMERPGRVFSREQLLDGVWGSEVYIDERTVDVHVGRLRKALNRGHATDPIRTVRGAGYSLDDRFGKTA
jgi:DNA-binding response OmpR family regulator